MYQPKGVPSSNFSWNNSSGHGQYIDSGANAIDSMDGGNHSNNPSLASKQRLRWTNELHERFVDAVGQLGGPDRKPLNYFFFRYSLHQSPCFLVLLPQQFGINS